MVVQCNTCGKKTANSVFCPGCHDVSYCSTECQTQDWAAEHGKSCSTTIVFAKRVGSWFYGKSGVTDERWQNERATHLHTDAATFIATSGLLFPGALITEDLLREIVLRCTGDWDEIASDLRGAKDVPINPAFDGSVYRVGGVLVPYNDCISGQPRYLEAEEARIPHMFACEELRVQLLPLSSMMDTETVKKARRLISRAGHIAITREEILDVGEHMHLESPEKIDSILEAATNVKREIGNTELREYFHVAPHHDEIIARMPTIIRIINSLLANVDTGTVTIDELTRWQSQLHNMIVTNRPFPYANGKVARLLVNVMGWRARREKGLIILKGRNRCETYYQRVCNDVKGRGGFDHLSRLFVHLLESNERI